jgi:hypothetical protein
MNFEPGNHFARPEGNFKLDVATDIIFLHFKYLSQDYVYSRYSEVIARQSEENIKNNWGWHMSKSREKISIEFNDIGSRLIRVIE